MDRVYLVLFVFSLVIGMLLAETRVSARNQRALRARGARLPGGDVFGLMAVAYPAAFLAMGVEGIWRATRPVGDATAGLFVSGVLLMIASKALKYWAIGALGVRWSFRVWVLPGEPLVTTGPYQYVRHPNYIAVMGELAGAAMMMGAWVSGPCALALFGAILWLRIRFETGVLRQAYQKES